MGRTLCLATALAACVPPPAPSAMFSCRTSADCEAAMVCARDGVCRLPGDGPPAPLGTGLMEPLNVVPQNGRLIIRPTGGLPPFRFRVTSGAGSFEGDTFVAPGFSTPVTVLVTDAAGQLAEAVLYVVQAQRQTGGLYHFCRILSGRVKCWGYNASGFLGLGAHDNRGDQPGEMGAALPFIDLGTGRTAYSVTAGTYFTCALLDTLQVKCWGQNEFGQLGLEDSRLRGASLGEMGDALPFVDLGTGRKVLAVSAGGYHVCALLDNQSIKCWGTNSDGEAGLGRPGGPGRARGTMGDALASVDLGPNAVPTHVAVGRSHSCALLLTGDVACWGDNAYGQLLTGAQDDLGLAATDLGSNLRPIQLGTGAKATGVFAGEHNTCVRLSTGALKCGGAGHAGQHGAGLTSNVGRLPQDVGDALPTALLGQGFEVASVAIAGLGTTVSVCATSTAGALKCWGTNEVGELGQGDTAPRGPTVASMGDALTPVDLGTGARAVDVAGASGSSYGRSFCAELSDGRLKCWGGGAFGQLGLGTAESKGASPDDMGDNLPAVALEE